MSRYFFNFCRGPTVVEDPEGGEFRDHRAAREYAILAARDVMRARFARYGPDWSDWRVSVSDEQGREVVSVSFKEADLH
jgi:hypothetical protein